MKITADEIICFILGFVFVQVVLAFIKIIKKIKKEEDKNN